MEHYTAVSDGNGTIDRGEVDVDESSITPPVFEKSNRTVEHVESNPFADLPTYRDAKSIPPSLASVFNKIMEYEQDGVTYRYREISFLELLSLGTNPFMLEMLDTMGGDEEIDTKQMMEDLQNRDPDELMQMTAQAKIHRDKVLLRSLVDIRAGEDVIAVDASVIATMQDPIRDALYDVISGGETAETEAVAEFPEGTDPNAGGDDLPSGN